MLTLGLAKLGGLNDPPNSQAGRAAGGLGGEFIRLMGLVGQKSRVKRGAVMGLHGQAGVLGSFAFTVPFSFRFILLN